MKFVVFCFLTGYIVFVNGLCSNIHAADFPLPCYSHKKDEIFDFYSSESPKQTLISKFMCSRWESAGTIHKDIRRWAFNFFHADQQETRFLWKHKPTETDHFKLIWMNADLCVRGHSVWCVVLSDLVEDLEDGDRTSQPKDKVVTWNLPFRSDTSYLVQSTT